jgi:4-amino-4-deoxy-L-arabinose transferase-like glycosyltransferase
LDRVFLSRNTYRFLFFLLGLVYCFGLFVPLMDNDSAHHADIALHMHLTGDYVNLIDFGRDYLDKPHFHFWLCAFSYKIFGVTTFAYKFPSFLFTILGTYSTFRLGKALYDVEIGKLASLIVASAFAYILANNDVRMDAILTSCIVFTTWQLVEFIQNKKWLNVAGAALGLALGFSTKGHIAVFVPAVAAFFYILYLKEWKLFLNWKWLPMLVLFGLFISPVVYCYYLQYNLHPEKIVRGKDHINGVKFILFNQSVERFSGEMGHDGKNDYLFFIHSFCWAFAPWSMLAFIALAGRIRNFMQRKDEWLSTGVFIVVLLVVTFSGFKLPHYLNIVFPSTAVMVAAFIIGKEANVKWIRIIYLLQLIVAVILLVLLSGVTFWAFPVKKLFVIAGVVLLLAIFFYFIRSEQFTRLQKAVCLSVSAMALFFFLLNANFYPQLLKYQAGKELAVATEGKIIRDDVYFWKDTYSSSYVFYAKSLYRLFADSVLQSGKKIWVVYDIRAEEEIKQAGYKLGESFSTIDFEITRLDIKFINPARRESQCTKMVIAEISK